MGRSGLKVSEICLGTMTFGHGTDQNEAQKIVDTAFDAGINFIDTADSYSQGEAETMLGRCLGTRRADAVIASKFFNPMGTGPNDSGMSRRYIFQAIDASLKRLQTDYLDVYYIHHVDIQTPLDEMLRALDDIVRQGKVRYVGCSNYEAWRLMESLWISERHGWSRFECYQPQYNLVVRDIEQELIPICERQGLGVVTWAPLAGGFLSGKYQPGQRTLAGTRSEESWAYPASFFAANADETLTELLEIANELGIAPAQIAIRWVLEQPAITSAIIGPRTITHAQANLGAADLKLPAEMLERLSRVSHLPHRYPRSMEENMHERRNSAVTKR